LLTFDHSSSFGTLRKNRRLAESKTMEVFAPETGRLPEGNLRFPAEAAKVLKHGSDGCSMRL
jgi:hypothetical protein